MCPHKDKYTVVRSQVSESADIVYTHTHIPYVLVYTMQLGHCSRHTHQPHYLILTLPSSPYHTRGIIDTSLVPTLSSPLPHEGIRGYTDASLIPKLLPLPLPVPHKETYTQVVYVRLLVQMNKMAAKDTLLECQLGELQQGEFCMGLPGDGIHMMSSQVSVTCQHNKTPSLLIGYCNHMTKSPSKQYMFSPENNSTLIINWSQRSSLRIFIEICGVYMYVGNEGNEGNEGNGEGNDHPC